MDNRTGFRRRGHGYLADQARSALGIAGKIRVLAEIPLPMVHTAFGLAIAAAEVLLRPEAIRVDRSAAADTGLALVHGLVLVAYDFLIYPSDSRPGAGRGRCRPWRPSFHSGHCCTMYAVLPLPGIRITSSVIAAIVIGGVPRLAGHHALGKEGVVHAPDPGHLGVAVLAPVLLGGAITHTATAPSPSLPWLRWRSS